MRAPSNRTARCGVGDITRVAKSEMGVIRIGTPQRKSVEGSGPPSALVAITLAQSKQTTPYGAGDTTSWDN
jgi:hypothetical protein